MKPKPKGTTKNISVFSINQLLLILHPHSIIIICGPTAAGKTAVAVQLAQLLQTEIISADSRQCFKELNIGVAKPSAEELSAIQHHFINSHSIHQIVNAGIFEQYALHAAERIFEKHTTAVMVGGTGLYIKAFAEGMDEMPPVNPIVRNKIIDSYHENGLQYLQTQVAKNDPGFWKTAERENPQRLMRALEVLLSSGKSISAFRGGKKEKRAYNIIKIGIELPREQLYTQINNRVDAMMEQGLEQEAQALLPQRNLNALQTVGYHELFDFFDGKVSLHQAVENIKTSTRHYAKRQLTWFKKDQDITWFNPHSSNLFNSISEKFLLTFHSLLKHPSRV